MRIIERIVDRFKKAGVENVPIKALEYPTFPNFRIDFKPGAFGASGFDLANAFSQDVIQTADLLEIIAKGSRRQVLYIEPELGQLGQNGYHRVHEIRDSSDLPSITSQGEIASWKKVRSGAQEDKDRLSKYLSIKRTSG